jgi:amino acid transporter
MKKAGGEAMTDSRADNAGAGIKQGIFGWLCNIATSHLFPFLSCWLLLLLFFFFQSSCMIGFLIIRN